MCCKACTERIDLLWLLNTGEEKRGCAHEPVVIVIVPGRHVATALWWKATATAPRAESPALETTKPWL